MANVGSAAIGKTYIGNGVGASGTFASIGTNSGLSTHGVVISQGLNPFSSVVPAAIGTVLMSNGPGVDPSFQSGGTILANTITGNSGGSLSPIGGNWNILGTGSITTSGSGATLTTQLTGLTNHSVLLGAGTATMNSLTNGTTGQVLTAVTGADPIWTSAGTNFSLNIQTFTGNGTYTPTSGMKYCYVELVGSGGGGGACPATGAGQMAVASGGGGGGYAAGVFSAATIGASKAVTVGAAGTGGSVGSNPGGNGNSSSLGVLISATGGTGGLAGVAAANGGLSGSAGGTGSGTVNITGGTGSDSWSAFVAITGCSGSGGNSQFGDGGAARVTGIANSFTGFAGTGFGSGGGGGANGQSQSAIGGGNGTAGYVKITEYIFT